MLAQMRLLTLQSVAAAGARPSVMNSLSRLTLRCSSHTAVSSEDAVVSSIQASGPLDTGQQSPHLKTVSSHVAFMDSYDLVWQSGKPYINILTAGGHTFKGDLRTEPWGGGGTAPEPKDYAYAALAVCTSMTVRLYADRKKWPLTHVEVEVQEINGRPGIIPDGLRAILKLEGDLTDEQKNELLRISANCPVKQIFSGKMTNGVTSQISEFAASS